jgi:hypothetical protein
MKFILDSPDFNLGQAQIDTKLDFIGVGPNRPQTIEKKVVRIAGGKVSGSGPTEICSLSAVFKAR